VVQNVPELYGPLHPQYVAKGAPSCLQTLYWKKKINASVAMACLHACRHDKLSELHMWLPHATTLLSNALTAYLSCSTRCSALVRRHQIQRQPFQRISFRYLSDLQSHLIIDAELQAYLRTVHTAAQQICRRGGGWFGLTPSVWEFLDSLVVQAEICELHQRNNQVQSSFFL
jgi:hypothetical protein